uniref:Pilus assembly protein Flp/PilA n=1 Tax=Syphacia muris TaxID=451379 RepID=A0A0N5B173_9BILA
MSIPFSKCIVEKVPMGASQALFDFDLAAAVVVVGAVVSAVVGAVGGTGAADDVEKHNANLSFFISYVNHH